MLPVTTSKPVRSGSAAKAQAGPLLFRRVEPADYAAIDEVLEKIPPEQWTRGYTFTMKIISREELDFTTNLDLDRPDSMLEFSFRQYFRDDLFNSARRQGQYDYGVDLAYADEEVDATAAEANVAELLGVPRGASILPNADALYNSASVPHDSRWDLDLPDFAATLRYREEVLCRTLESLARAGVLVEE